MYRTEEEYIAIDKYEQLKEEYITQICRSSKKVKSKNRSLIIAWVLADLFLITNLFLSVANGRYSSPFFLLGLIIAKIIVVLIIKNSVRNIVGLAFNVAVAVLSAHFNLLDVSLPILFVSTTAHIAAIPCAYTLEKLKSVCLYPSFNAFVFCGEAKKDPGFFKLIKNGYDDLFAKPICRYEFAVTEQHPAIKPVRFAAVALICAGAVLHSIGAQTISAYNRAEMTTSLEHCYNGMSVKGTIDTIYIQSSVPMDKYVSAEFWCEFGGQYVMFSVPDSYVEPFAKLYNYCVSTNEHALPYRGYREITEMSSDSVGFVGIVRSPEKYGDIRINTKIDKLEKLGPELINGELYIELIDKSKADKESSYGSTMLFIGILAAAVSYLSLFIEKNSLQELTVDIFTDI